MKTLSRDALARMVALHLPAVGFVNLGIGAPTHVGDYLPLGSAVILHSENGILNVGPRPEVGMEDPDLINAGKMPITVARGGSFFDSTLSFAMMRGGHLDLAILGAFQVAANGDLANWTTGDASSGPPGIGGAIDLAVGAKAIWVMMDHTTREGKARIVTSCAYPLTAQRVVRRIFTNLAIIDVTPNGLILDAVIEGSTHDDVQRVTVPRLGMRPLIRTIQSDGTVVIP